jgi:hypothetical protein
MIVGNRMVGRIVAICDTDGDLPMVYSRDAAAGRLDHLLTCRTSGPSLRAVRI